MRRRLQEIAANVVDRIGNDRIRTINRDNTGTDSNFDVSIDSAENSGEGEENERGDFVLDAVTQKEVGGNEDKRGDSSDEQEDNNRRVDSKQDHDNEDDPQVERDFTSYDTWMGILSSSSIKYFVRIVSSSEVGVVSV